MSGTFMLNNRNYTASGNLRLGGGASVIQKTMAEYTALPSSEKMNGSIYKITDKALIYCLDEEYHAYKELTSAQYTALSSEEKNNGTLYIITDEETTAADIPYSSGVSVADMLSELNSVTSGDLSVIANSGITINGSAKWYKCGKVVFIVISNVIFDSIKTNIACLSGCPKPLFQPSAQKSAGASVSDSNLIVNDTCYIPIGSTNIIFTVGSNYSVRHWFQIQYITSE